MSWFCSAPERLNGPTQCGNWFSASAGKILLCHPMYQDSQHVLIEDHLLPDFLGKFLYLRLKRNRSPFTFCNSASVITAGSSVESSSL